MICSSGGREVSSLERLAKVRTSNTVVLCDVAVQIRKVVAPRITTCQPADFCYTKLNFMPPPIFMIEPFVFCRIMTSSPESAFQLSFLYSRSPKARDRLRLPLTRYWLGLDCKAEQQLVLAQWSIEVYQEHAKLCHWNLVEEEKNEVSSFAARKRQAVKPHAT